VVRRGLDLALAAGASADGLSVAGFEPAAYKPAADRGHRSPRRLGVGAPGAGAAATSAAGTPRGIHGAAANLPRGLANEPGNTLTPKAFADRVAADAKSVGLTVDVLDETRIRALKMGLLLAVAQGSVEPPRLVVLRHDPKGAPESPVLGLIGKGITF